MSRTSESAPSASHCQTSTIALLSGLQEAPVMRETWNAKRKGTPGFTEPSEGSERMSERLSFSSIKYGPSVCSGRTTQESIAAASAVAREVNDVVGSRDLRKRLQPKNTAAVPVPKSASISRRLNNWTVVVFFTGRLIIGLLNYTTIPDRLKRRCGFLRWLRLRNVFGFQQCVA